MRGAPWLDFGWRALGLALGMGGRGDDERLAPKVELETASLSDAGPDATGPDVDAESPTPT
jgi:hypothetical protein